MLLADSVLCGVKVRHSDAVAFKTSICSFGSVDTSKGQLENEISITIKFSGGKHWFSKFLLDGCADLGLPKVR